MTIRYTLPTKYDVAPYGTIVDVVDENMVIEQSYIQLGDDKHIVWMKLGDFFVEAFKEEIKNPEFIAGCLQLYKMEQ